MTTIEELHTESLKVDPKMNMKDRKVLFQNQRGGQQVMIGKWNNRESRGRHIKERDGANPAHVWFKNLSSHKRIRMHNDERRKKRR